MKDPGASRPDRDGADGGAGPGLTRQTLGGFMWLFGGGGTEAVAKIVVLIVLARLLAPSEFGVVSAALTVVALAEVTGRIGVAPSIVQTRVLHPEQVATGFTATLLIGAAMTVAIFFLADAIAQLYRMPDLAVIVQVFSVLFVIKGAGLVSEALLQRAMRFRDLAFIRLASYLIGYAAVALGLAAAGFGAWALVFGQLAQAGLQSVLFILRARDGLGIGFRWATFLEMFRFGLGVTLTQIGNYFSQNADYFVVGRWLGADALGFYSRAYLLMQQPAQLVGKVGDQVLFPAFATIQDDPERLERALNRALSLVALVQVPLTALLLVTAPEIILGLMGPQWGPAVLPFQILIGVLFFRTGYKLVGAILRATGKVYVSAIWQWSHAAAVLGGAMTGQLLGIWGVAAGVAAAVVFCHLSGLFLVHRVIGVRSADSLRRLLLYAAFGGALAAALAAAKFGLVAAGVQGLTLLSVLSFMFALSFAAVFLAAPGLFGAEGATLQDFLLRAVRRKTGRRS